MRVLKKASFHMVEKAILFINGEIDLDFCEHYIRQHLSDLPIYCADGAFNQLKYSKFLMKQIRLVIGDGDSIKSAELTEVPYQQDEDQNSTDFEKSLVLLAKEGYTTLFLFGFGGREMDHYLGNLSTLFAYQQQFDFTIIDRHGMSQILPRKLQLKNVKGKMISIVPLFELTSLTLKGCAFDLNQYTLRFAEQVGTRNHAIAQCVSIEYEKGNGLVFVSHGKYHRFDE